MTHEMKKHLLNLYFLALSDGNFQEKERETILEIAKEKGLTQQEFEETILNPPPGIFQAPETFLDRIFLLYDFARIILADGIIHDDEKSTFFKFCERFGFDSPTTQELFEWLIELAKQNLTLTQVRQEISNLINE